MIEGASVNVKDFGAVGDGVTDDRVALQAALDYACDNNGILILDKRTYAISGTIYIRADSDIVIEGMGSTIIKTSDWTGSWLWCERLVDNTTTITLSDIGKNTRSISVDSAAERDKFSPGDLFTLSSDKLWYYDNRGSIYKGETHLVDSLSDSVDSIFLQKTIFDSYDVTGVDSEVVTLTIHRKTKLVLRDLVFQCNRGINSSIGLNNLVGSLIENVHITNGLNLGIGVTNCYNTTLSNCTVQNQIAQATGYGVQVNNSTDCRVVDSKFFGNRRGVDLSGTTPTRSCMVSRNFFDGGGYDENGDDYFDTGNSSACGSHSPADANVYSDNIATNVYYAFISRGQQEVFQNNLVYGKCYGYFASVDGGSVSVVNNRYQSGNINGSDEWLTSLSVFATVYNRATRGVVVVKGNTADYIEDGFLSIRDSDSRGFCTDYEISDNHINLFGVSGGGGSTWVYFVKDVDEVGIELRNSSITNNRVGAVRADGGYSKYHFVTPQVIEPDTSCVIEDYEIPVTMSHGGTGSATIDAAKIFVDVMEETTSVRGYVEVTVTGVVDNLYIEGFPKQVFGQELSFSSQPYLSATPVYWTYNGFTGSQGRFYLHSDPATLGSALPAGTYSIPLNIEYRNTVDSPY